MNQNYFYWASTPANVVIYQSMHASDFCGLFGARPDRSFSPFKQVWSLGFLWSSLRHFWLVFLFNFLKWNSTFVKFSEYRIYNHWNCFVVNNCVTKEKKAMCKLRIEFRQSACSRDLPLRKQTFLPKFQNKYNYWRYKWICRLILTIDRSRTVIFPFIIRYLQLQCFIFFEKNIFLFNQISPFLKADIKM